MKVLITGISGFIGSELARRLVQKKEVKVAGLVRSTSDKDHLAALDDLISKITLFYASLTDYHAVRNILRAFRPDYIVHLGAKTAVRESFEMPYEFNEVNYLGTINLANSAMEIPDFKKFIFASTQEVYGWQKSKKPFKEETILHPASPYAVSKVASEKYIEMASRAYGFPYLISRATNSFGRKHNTGFIVEYLITTMLQGQDVYLGTPKAVRDLMYVDDHVSAYLKLLEIKLMNQTFNFSTASQTKMLELAILIKKKLNFKGKIIPRFPPDYHWRPVSEEYLSMDASKARKLLGWKPKYSLEKGLDKTIAYWKTKVGNS